MGEELPYLTEKERVEAWRLARFLDMGFSATLAERLTASDADLHHTENRLLARGATHEQAVEIAV